MERILSQRKLQRITSPPDFVHDTATLSQSNQFRSFTGGISEYISDKKAYTGSCKIEWCCGKTFFQSSQLKSQPHTRRDRDIYSYRWFPVKKIKLCVSLLDLTATNVAAVLYWAGWTTSSKIGRDNFGLCCIIYWDTTHLFEYSRMNGSFCWELICKIHVYFEYGHWPPLWTSSWLLVSTFYRSLSALKALNSMALCHNQSLVIHGIFPRQADHHTV